VKAVPVSDAVTLLPLEAEELGPLSLLNIKAVVTKAAARPCHLGARPPATSRPCCERAQRGVRRFGEDGRDLGAGSLAGRDPGAVAAHRRRGLAFVRRGVRAMFTRQVAPR